MRLFHIFKIKRDEWWLAIAAFTILLLLNALVVGKYYESFTLLSSSNWNVLVKGFHISGFDSITYYVVSDWHVRYNVYRHPLLSFLMYVPYLLNLGLMKLTGINCTLFIVASMLIVSSLYSVLFFYRIMYEIIGVSRKDCLILTAFFFSFAHIMLATLVPDHFAYSLFALLFTLYISGCMMREHRQMKIHHTILLFLLTAGISLNNGLKVFLASLFTDGRKFWHPKHLILAVVLPSLAIWGFARFEYHHFVWADEKARHEAKAHRIAEKKQAHIAQLKAQTDSVNCQNRQKGKPRKAVIKTKKQKCIEVQGSPFMKGEFMNWTDKSTPRLESAVENFFGESIQLHEDWVLGDIFCGRPVIVYYSTPLKWVNYAVEVLIFLLFIVGIAVAVRRRFFLMVGSWFLLDLLLHIGLGFGLNEVYIMAAHWAFIIPIAIGYLLLRSTSSVRRKLHIVLTILMLFLWGYNVSLLIGYMLG